MEKIRHCIIRPHSPLKLLSQQEVAGLAASNKDTMGLFRNCALAILNTDSQEDDAAQVLASFADFDIQVIPQSRGLTLEIHNAPAQAFVAGEMIRGIHDHLFSALRDIVYTDFIANEVAELHFDSSEGITDAVFRILRNAEIVRGDVEPNMVVCWGGHSIPRHEYDYSKEVGYRLGLRGLDIITGCGIGAMKGPMKGAAVGHAKQQIKDGRYIGISEPGIIASESPNAIVNELSIMPDIEKRLEAFVRLAHSIIVFPGGVGTVEEILYLLSILMHPDNEQKIPLILAGPDSCQTYFYELEAFLVATLGEQVKDYYQIIIGDPIAVAALTKINIEAVHRHRKEKQEAYYFNWPLAIDHALQAPFIPSHKNMANLALHSQLQPHQLATNMRAAFSGIVAGNVKAFGQEQVAKHGPYALHGDSKILSAIEKLLQSLIRDKRMKIVEQSEHYTPCYSLHATD
ncbi:LOG family protein [Gammaproteobacteria bacterium 50_400_T64]|nr:LOG family protein [Gammaproteobacteria bacterium 50_400_T64]